MSGSLSGGDPNAAITTGQIQPAQSNPLGMIGQYQSILNAQAQNAQIKASTANTQQNTVNQAQDNQIKGFSFNQTQQNYMQQQLGSLLAGPPSGLTRANAIATATQTHELFGTPDDAFQSVVARINATPDDPNDIAAFLRQGLVSTVPGADQAKTVLPNQINVNEGNRIVGGTQQPAYGVPNPGAIQTSGQGAPVGNMSVSDSNTPFSWVDSKGVLQQKTKLLYLQAVQAGLASPGQSGLALSNNNGSYNNGPVKPVDPATQALSGTGGGVSGPSYQQQAQNNAVLSTGAHSADRYSQTLDQVASAEQNNTRIQQVLDGADVNPVGPGADKANEAKEALAALFRQAGQPVPTDLGTQSMAAALSDKDVAQLVTNADISAKSLGAMEAAAAGTPSNHIDYGALRDGMLHLKAYSYLAVDASNESGNDPIKFSQQMSQMSQSINPMGLVWDSMTSAEKQHQISLAGPKGSLAYNRLQAGIAQGIDNKHFDPKNPYVNQFTGLAPGVQTSTTNPGSPAPVLQGPNSVGTMKEVAKQAGSTATNALSGAGTYLGNALTGGQ
jgi:hypothetical protein